jgi:dienelactone hydrolase
MDEAFGMNDEMDRVAADLADEGGWTVLIPDLFARSRQPLCVARCPQSTQQLENEVVALRNDLDRDGRA